MGAHVARSTTCFLSILFTLPQQKRLGEASFKAILANPTGGEGISMAQLSLITYYLGSFFRRATAGRAGCEPVQIQRAVVSLCARSAANSRGTFPSCYVLVLFAARLNA